jgi:hypothetical protein
MVETGGVPSTSKVGFMRKLENFALKTANIVATMQGLSNEQIVNRLVKGLDLDDQKLSKPERIARAKTLLDKIEQRITKLEIFEKNRSSWERSTEFRARKWMREALKMYISGMPAQEIKPKLVEMINTGVINTGG